MRVSLKVLNGSNAGRVVQIPVTEFIIGRKDGCHLRPRSDLVSRKHCVIVITDAGLRVRDLKSRNGTFVNDTRVDGEVELKDGDKLKVGKMEFQVLVDYSLGGTKRPKVRDVKDAAARTAAVPATPESNEDPDIDAWLEQADLIERERRMTDPESRQFKVDETDRVPLHPTPEITETVSNAEPETSEDTKIVKKKKEPGKLPKKPPVETRDSGDAAARVLKDFFNRR